MKYVQEIIGIALLAVAVCAADNGFAQRPDALYPGFPGEPVKGYYQPVMICAPEGVRISGIVAGQFAERFAAPYQAGFLIGRDYRLRVTDIPLCPGKEVYPTLTLLARTYPPPRRELDFPIMINITQEDLELALDGRYVIRVIYLEDPKKGVPVRTKGDDQISFDTNHADPIAIAATRGTPIAILRLGGRVPNTNRGLLEPAFCFGSPPWVLNRTIPPDYTGVETAAGKRQTTENVLAINPALKSAGQATLEEARRGAAPNVLPNTWRPPNASAPDGWHPSEYLADGGDADLPIQVAADWSVKHFNSEDTVAHYDTLDGRTLVTASNRLHIYAPRFGAVRRIEGLQQEGQVTGIVQTNGRETLGKGQHSIQTGMAAHEAKARTARNQDQPNRLDEQRRAAGSAVAAGLSGYNNFQEVDTESVMLRQKTFLLDQTDRLRIERMGVNVYSWMGSAGTRISFDSFPPVSASNVDGAAAFFQVDDKMLKVPKIPKLRLIKIASKESALPGETVEFTLRFDNIGSALIGNVTILDSLTGRLELVPGSAVCSLKSGFNVETNESGSLSLRFEITDPLPPGEFGVIQFQCRVR